MHLSLDTVVVGLVVGFVDQVSRAMDNREKREKSGFDSKMMMKKNMNAM